jgi:hypothetical protein
VVFKDKKNAGFRVALIVALLAAMYGVLPTGASVQASPAPNYAKNNCQPGTGWMWTTGPSQPEIASQAQGELAQQGVDALVEARGYGETDSCGTYLPRGVDFSIQLADKQFSAQENVNEAILSTLDKHGKPGLGNVKLFSPDGKLISNNINNTAHTANEIGMNALSADALAGESITKNVYVIVYDPLLSSSQKLSQHMGWNDHATITQQTVDFFKQATNNKMNYVVTDTTVVTSGWPELVDGFTYTEQEYLAVMSGQQSPHQPTGVSYNKIVNSPEFDICGKANRGEIDEVWIYNGPWFGFYESTLVGPGAYYFNSPPVGGTHNCNRLIPIMGPSPERSVDEAVHNFTHRTESTMSKVYGGWQQNNTSHNWNKFALVKAQSPNYSYSGCGSSHYPPNATSDYNYANPSSVLSNCEDFLNYPTLSDPLQVAQPVTCSTWGCSQLGYFRYWFGHVPSFAGCAPDNATNDWWKYLANPGYALYPANACQPDMRIISGNVGAPAALLSYVDGTSKNVLTDTSGNYFLMVSNNWSGSVTPSKTGYSFLPASRTYADVITDMYNQDYTSQGGGPLTFYVNIATGNNSNSCTSIGTPCRDIQEAINKASAGDTIKVANGRYLFSSNPTPNVVIIDKNLTLSGGWNNDFTSQTGASTIDGANVNNGILVISGTVSVENFIVENSISSNSGAIYIVSGNLTLKRSTLRNNVATSNGAGIFVDNGAVTVINSTISGNRANGAGGGIYAANNSGASVTIQNSTIAYNQAARGGGISRTTGSYSLTNTIVANNTSSLSSPDCEGTIAAASFSLIENMAGCSITSGSNNLHVDPQLNSTLTGAMLVHMPTVTSSVIDNGTSTGCPAIDQLGTTRPYGNGCDIGAVEYVGAINTPTHTPTFTPTKTNTPTPTKTNTPTFTPTLLAASNALYLSLTGSQTVGGISSSDEDILRFNGSAWSVFFDGSDVGVGSPDLFAFSFLDADTLLLSFNANVTVQGISATPQDILRFDATSLGSTTAGTFSLYFDGSDVGLDTSSEVIDSISVLPDGRLLVSTTGSPVVPGLSTGRDEDVLAFSPTLLGNTTSGSWALYFDGSDVGLGDSNNEDVDALDVLSNGDIYLSTLGDFAVSGLSGADEDVFVCVPTSIGDVTACSYAAGLYFDGSTWGLAANDVDAFNYLAAGPIPTATHTPRPTLTATGGIPPTATYTPTTTPSQIVVSVTPTFTRTPTIVPSPTPTHTQTTGGSLLTFTPTADAYVDSGNPATNYGSLTTLRVDGSPVIRSYLRFNVLGLSGPVTRATLRIFANSASSQGCTASGVSDNTWSESTINYNNAPPPGSALGSSGPFAAGVWISMDVTAYIVGNGTYNLALTTPGSTAVSLASRQSGANAPQLIIETAP